MEIGAELERNVSNSQRGRARSSYRLSVYGKSVYGFSYSFWLRTVNPCDVNTPWMINVLSFAFLPFSGLKDEQGFIYSRITNSTTMKQRAFNHHIHISDK